MSAAPSALPACPAWDLVAEWRWSACACRTPPPERAPQRTAPAPADLYVDNERLIRVEGHRLAQALPSKLRAALRDERLLLPSAGGHPPSLTLQTAASGAALVSVRKAPIVKSTAPSREGTAHGSQLLQPLLGSLRGEPRSV